jgi:hypothetical protein
LTGTNVLVTLVFTMLGLARLMRLASADILTSPVFSLLGIDE